MINYEKIFKKNTDVNFNEIGVLNSMDISDLFFYLANSQKNALQNFKNHARENSDLFDYLEKIGFFAIFVNITKKEGDSAIERADDIKFFDRMKFYSSKQDFYGEYEEIFSEFIKIGFSKNNAALITSSIGEIIDNAFYHNLGQWNSEFGPLVVFIAQHIPDKKNINISVCDFGVGFLSTLAENYPFLKTEGEAIAVALKANTTGRINKAGGNGLVYLQKNIFNGFAGNIMIRSKNVLVAVDKKEQTKIISDKLPLNYGVNIFINLNY